MKKNHGVLGTLAWGLFLPIGAIVARYLKHKDPLWYYLHAGVQFLGFLLGLANVVLGQQLYNKIDANIPSHRGIGIFALTLSILQVCPRLILCTGAFHNHMKCILINAPNLNSDIGILFKA